ncbi:hypothetical protein [Paenibacillus macerans]|uniref:hypothetical protein n=1 Tax=Paenibacillus macerans TaxID=44252 RepID=UPI003D31FD38
MYLVQTVIGIFVVDKLMVANMELLETEGALALSDPAFLQNHAVRLAFVWFQVAVTVFIVIISVWKPWKKKKA